MADNKKEKVGVQDIADILNISASTVSRALNDHPRISRDTKDKVWQVARRLGYFSGMPEYTPPEKSDAVAVLIPSLRSSFYREVIDGIEDYFDKKGFDVFIVNTRNDNGKAAGFFSKYKSYGISGVIHIVSDKTGSDLYKVPMAEALPVVTVLEPDKNTGVSSVLPDLYHGIYNSLKHLFSIGSKNITLLLEDENCPLDNQIVNSFASAMESVFGSFEGLSVYYTGRNEKGLKNFTNAVLSAKNRPEAIFIKDIYSAFSVENDLGRAGIEVPDDVLLVTIDTASGAKQLRSNMSILKLPAYEMGYKAAGMLLARIKDPRLDKKVAVVPANFVLKGSAMRFS